MAFTTVTINGENFEVPQQSTSPQWGSELHDTVVALATAVESISGSADIPLTSFSLANNQSSASNITGASFDTGTVRSFILQYSLYRSTASNEEAEVGTLWGTYLSTASVWRLAQNYAGASGITFSITNGGQLQYQSTNLAGASYSGTIKFKAGAFLQ